MVENFEEQFEMMNTLTREDKLANAVLGVTDKAYKAGYSKGYCAGYEYKKAVWLPALSIGIFLGAILTIILMEVRWWHT